MPKTSVITKKQPKTIDFDTKEINDNSIPKISVREYMRNFKLYNQKVMEGASFIIAKNDENQVMITLPPVKQKKKYSMKDLLTMIIPKDVDNDPYVSENIDNIAYGI